MTNHRIHQAASQHAPHITLTVNRVNHAAITHLNNFAAPQHSLHPGATSNAAHNTVTRRTTLAATNHTDGSAIALHMTHTTIINDRPHAATREHRSDNTTTRHHANTCRPTPPDALLATHPTALNATFHTTGQAHAPTSVLQ